MRTLGLCVVVHQRPGELLDALASAEASAFDEVLVLDMASDPPVPPVPGVRWSRSDENTGVAAGRNRLLEAATADVLVFLDDDAVLRAPVDGLRDLFGEDPGLAVVAFRVERPGGAVEPSEHPFRGRPRDVPPGPCAYFVGAGYAVRRSAVEAVGGYDERFFYSTEEVDLSFALLRDGWRLEYRPELVVEHRPSARGRAVRPEVPAMRARNRITLVRRHLPAPLATVHVAAWLVRTWREARSIGQTAAWRRGVAEGWRSAVDRRPLGWRTVLAAHRNGGRVLW